VGGWSAKWSMTMIDRQGARLGNDFLLVAEKDAPASIAPWARRLCDRHIGVGADGVLLHSLAPDGVRMRLINADGGEVELSGNGLRCLAGYMVWSGVRPARHVVHTVSGPRPVEVETLGPGRYRIATGLGPPSSTARTSPSPSIRRPRSWITADRGRGDGARDRHVAGQPALRGLPRRARGRRAPLAHGTPAGAASLLPAAHERRVRYRTLARPSCACASGSAAWATRAPPARARPARRWPPSSGAWPTGACVSSATGGLLEVEWPEGGDVRRWAKWRSFFEESGWYNRAK
jgi:hypothetical protein